MAMSAEIPLLDEDGQLSEQSEDLEDLEYNPKHLARKMSRKTRFYHSFPSRVSLAVAAGVLVLGAQSVVLWKVWSPPSPSDVLGEINGLVPAGESRRTPDIPGTGWNSKS